MNNLNNKIMILKIKTFNCNLKMKQNNGIMNCFAV